MQQLEFMVQDGRILEQLSDRRSLLGLAYSGGGAGKWPISINNPPFQNQHDVGPIPKGKYIGKLVIDPSKGPRVWTLTPDPGNNMFGRSGFMIHWDNHAQNFSASDGCIVPVMAVTFYRIQDEFELLVT